MKNAYRNKWKYKPQRMRHGEEAAVERNLFTAINRSECRANGLLGHMTYARPQRGMPPLPFFPSHYPVPLGHKNTGHKREDMLFSNIIFHFHPFFFWTGCVESKKEGHLDGFDLYRHV